MTDFVAFESYFLDKIRSVAQRLYTEQRMNGDDMRDAAHTIMAAVNNAITLENATGRRIRCSCGNIVPLEPFADNSRDGMIIEVVGGSCSCGWEYSLTMKHPDPDAPPD